MTAAVTAIIILGMLGSALRPLQHALYAVHILWVALIAWLAGSQGWIANEVGPELTAPLLIIHLVIINIVTFMAYGFDKYAAQKGGWRIAEKTLHSFSLIGGTFGALFGSRTFRHKTKKVSFRQMSLVVNVMQVLIALAFFFVF